MEGKGGPNNKFLLSSYSLQKPYQKLGTLQQVDPMWTMPQQDVLYSSQEK